MSSDLCFMLGYVLAVVIVVVVGSRPFEEGLQAPGRALLHVVLQAVASGPGQEGIKSARAFQNPMLTYLHCAKGLQLVCG